MSRANKEAVISHLICSSSLQLWKIRHTQVWGTSNALWRLTSPGELHQQDERQVSAMLVPSTWGCQVWHRICDESEDEILWILSVSFNLYLIHYDPPTAFQVYAALAQELPYWLSRLTSCIVQILGVSHLGWGKACVLKCAFSLQFKLRSEKQHQEVLVAAVNTVAFPGACGSGGPSTWKASQRWNLH